MADANRKNRLSPPLMHLFRESFAARDAKTSVEWTESGAVDGPARARSRAQQRSAITEPALRREVSRDVETLMNSIAMESSVDLSHDPFVRRSILNFGFPDITHRTIDELRTRDLMRDIEEALRNFEPRLVPRTVKVQRDASVNADELKIRYIVHGDLMCEPVNLPVQFVAEVEVESGKVAIGRI